MAGHFERVTDSVLLPRWVVREHEARYAFCRSFVRDKIVLDCGSGEGKGSKAIAMGKPRLLIAIDRSLPSVRLARGERIEPVAADTERLPVRGRLADVVVALEVIEHFANPEAFLTEAARVLRDGGTFICSTPNRIVRNPLSALSDRPLNPWHLREWSPSEFRSLLSTVFGEVELLAQQPQSVRMTRSFEWLAKIISRRGAAILRQLVKIPLAIMPSSGRYGVRAMDEDWDYEFVVAVCSEPVR
ncbi:MAG TPA: class I SAM-dependent methyltransferase [Thermoanaerobaculia bacterium]|jgi:SAM-dependent methyltransferase|nr:class I SAM-dependent methyltransferase [Thermoanaerobaculia bacterium]